MLMAEMGARVIKVEPPGKGDDAREYGPFRNGKSTYFALVNRGKQSLALDLKDASKDRAIFDKLLAKADVLVENFARGRWKSSAMAGIPCTRAIRALSMPPPPALAIPAPIPIIRPMTWWCRGSAAS